MNAFVAVISVLVLLTLIAIYRALRGGLVGEIEGAIERLSKAAAHHVEVSAVLALTEKFKSDPALAERLNAYSHDVVAAAMMFRINALGDDIHEMQRQLSKKRRSAASNASYDTLLKEDEEAIERLENLLDDLFRQLDEAQEAMQVYERPAAVT